MRLIDKTATEAVYDEEWYENTEIENLRKLLGGVECFMDVGASAGPYSKAFYNTIDRGRIIAVEANPETFKELETQVDFWQSENPKEIDIKCINKAVSDEAGKVTFTIARSALVSRVSFGDQFDDGNEDGGRKVEVESVSLDDIVAATEIPDLLKLDIEGYEYRALLGATKMLEAQKTRFLVEIHPWGDPSINKKPSDVYKLMMKRGYRFSRFHRHWLFEPGQAKGLAKLKQLMIARVMDSTFLRRLLKSPAIFMDKITGK